MCISYIPAQLNPTGCSFRHSPVISHGQSHTQTKARPALVFKFFPHVAITLGQIHIFKASIRDFRMHCAWGHTFHFYPPSEKIRRASSNAPIFCPSISFNTLIADFILITFQHLLPSAPGHSKAREQTCLDEAFWLTKIPGKS